MKKYEHNIVIYDDHTDWFEFGNISCQICGVRKHRGLMSMCEEQEKTDETYGCILLELESPFDDEDADITGAYILCKTEKDYHEAYNRCCDAVMNHPKVIDLRGLDAKLVEG